MRTKKEIEDLLNDHLPDGPEGRSKWPGMTYEQGAQAMADWITGYTDDDPLADE